MEKADSNNKSHIGTCPQSAGGTVKMAAGRNY